MKNRLQALSMSLGIFLLAGCNYEIGSMFGKIPEGPQTQTQNLPVSKNEEQQVIPASNVCQYKIVIGKAYLGGTTCGNAPRLSEMVSVAEVRHGSLFLEFKPWDDGTQVILGDLIFRRPKESGTDDVRNLRFKEDNISLPAGYRSYEAGLPWQGFSSEDDDYHFSSMTIYQKSKNCAYRYESRFIFPDLCKDAHEANITVKDGRLEIPRVEPDWSW